MWIQLYVVRVCACSVIGSCLTLVTSCTVAGHPPMSIGKNTGVGCHFLLQGIFLTQGLNPLLLHWQVDSLSLSQVGSPDVYLCVLPG